MAAEGTAMMGERQVWREALFHGFSLEEQVPADHLLRSIDRFAELTEAPIRAAPPRHGAEGPMRYRATRHD
jgi:hypothetical protein